MNGYQHRPSGSFPQQGQAEEDGGDQGQLGSMVKRRKNGHAGKDEAKQPERDQYQRLAGADGPSGVQLRDHSAGQQIKDGSGL